MRRSDEERVEVVPSGFEITETGLVHTAAVEDAHRAPRCAVFAHGRNVGIVLERGTADVVEVVDGIARIGGEHLGKPITRALLEMVAAQIDTHLEALFRARAIVRRPTIADDGRVSLGVWERGA
jgi:hypothetical protein